MHNSYWREILLLKYRCDLKGGKKSKNHNDAKPVLCSASCARAMAKGMWF